MDVYINGTKASDDFQWADFCGQFTGSLAIGQEQDAVGGGFSASQAPAIILDTVAVSSFSLVLFDAVRTSPLLLVIIHGSLQSNRKDTSPDTFIVQTSHLFVLCLVRRFTAQRGRLTEFKVLRPAHVLISAMGIYMHCIPGMLNLVSACCPCKFW